MVNPTEFVIIAYVGWYEMNVFMRGGGSYIAVCIFDASGSAFEPVYFFEGDGTNDICETLYLEEGVPYLIAVYGDGNFAFVFGLVIM
jgi:hypothetical protein